MTAEEPPAGGESQGAQAIDERARDDEQARSLARIEQGGITIAAEHRLREIGERGGAFTSDLSVADFALCHRLGIKPLAQVMGSSIYQVGYQYSPWPAGMGGSFMFEMEALSQAWNEVRGRALNRLAEEAGHVGADAVIGVELKPSYFRQAVKNLEHANENKLNDLFVEEPVDGVRSWSASLRRPYACSHRAHAILHARIHPLRYRDPAEGVRNGAELYLLRLSGAERGGAAE